MDLAAWRNRFGDINLRRIAILPEKPQSRAWPLLGMLALGLVTGAALGGYAISQRSQMKRLSTYAHRMRDELATMGKVEAEPDAAGSVPRSNHRRKAASEV
jgi:hypothetical protein